MMLSAMDGEQVPVTIIDHEPPPDELHHWVKGDGTGAPALEKAGVRQAAGIVAGTSNDVNNLSIAVTARQLNPNLFVILRQNHFANHSLFAAFDSDVDVVPSRIVAHECLAVLTTPLLVPFLDEMKTQDEAWCSKVLEQLTTRYSWKVPSVWSERINLSRAPALYRRLMRGASVELGDLLRAPHDRNESLPCTVLYLVRDDDDHILLPSEETEIRPGDKLLFAGLQHGRGELGLTLTNEHALNYVLTGTDLPGGLVWEMLAGRRNKAPAQASRSS